MKKKAEELFQQYIDKYPEDATAYFELSRLLANKKEIHEAVDLAGKAAKLDPSNIWYQLILCGSASDLMARYKDAICNL
jgi:tetratricopeptide (TPR) repeat protein